MDSVQAARLNVLGIASMAIGIFAGFCYLGLELSTNVTFPSIALASILGAVALWLGKDGREFGLVGIAVSAVTLVMIWTGFTL